MFPRRCSARATWLRETQKLDPAAVGHRVVHGGPQYDRPVRVDGEVLANLERYVSLAPLHQPNNLAPIRVLLARFPDLPQVACFDTAFHRGHSALPTITRSPSASTPKESAAMASMDCPTNTSPSACAKWLRPLPKAG